MDSHLEEEAGIRPSDSVLLRSIVARNFKSVRQASVELAALTVLVGENSAGKSSLIDTILLRTQAGEGRSGSMVPLNGSLIRLGAFEDVLNVHTDDQSFSIGGEIPLDLIRLMAGQAERFRSSGSGRRGGLSSRSRWGRRPVPSDEQTHGSDPFRALTAELLEMIDPGLAHASGIGFGRPRLTDQTTPADEGVELEWAITVSRGAHPNQNFGVVTGTWIKLKRPDGAVLSSVSAETDFSSLPDFESYEGLAYFGTDDLPQIGTMLGATMFGDELELSEPEVPVVQARLENGLPSELLFRRDARMHVAYKLMDLWSGVSRIGSQKQDPAERSIQNPIQTKRSSQSTVNVRQAIRRLDRVDMNDSGNAGDKTIPPEIQEDGALLAAAYRTGGLNQIQREKVEAFLPLKKLGKDADEAIDDLEKQLTFWANFFFEKYLPAVKQARSPDIAQEAGFTAASVADFVNEWAVNPLPDMRLAEEHAEDLRQGLQAEEVFAGSAFRFPDSRHGQSAATMQDAAIYELPRREDSWDLLKRVAARVEPQNYRSVIVENPDVNSLYRALNSVIRDVLSDRVYFVGPIREEPRPFYEDEPGGRSNHVGKRGQYTAALVSRLATMGVPKSPRPYPDPLVNEQLHEALDYWLGEEGLGLASKVKAFPKGAAGHSLKVLPIEMKHLKDSESGMVDLTAVGTGVSQVLPVIVQGLIAPEGSVLIFQQPELHLHPRLQQKLADFLLALTRAGRQVILETHSEYIVSRLALRAAESDAERDRIGLNMVTQTAEEGTIYKEAEIDEHGSIQWPSGFFDEASEGAVAILLAGAKRLEQSDDSDAGD